MALLGDWMVNLAPKVTDILNSGKLDVLVYSGDKDFICNWRGGEAWTNACNWTGNAEYDKQEFKDWKVGDTNAGALKTYKNLKMLRVFEAGHMVPMNQPEAALKMLNEFISGNILVAEPEEPEDEPRMPLQW
jgi:cathepsin A (carboxypeptidase C)